MKKTAILTESRATEPSWKLFESGSFPSAGEPPSLRRILIVDDDNSVRDSLMELLVLEGYVALPAKDGRQALEVMNQERVDLVLLDLNMPRLNGWDTFEKLIAKYPLVPIVIITARPNQLFLAASAGVGALLEKPLDIPVLLQAIKTLIDEDVETRLKRLTGRTSEFFYAAGHTPRPSQGQ